MDKAILEIAKKELDEDLASIVTAKDGDEDVMYQAMVVQMVRSANRTRDLTEHSVNFLERADMRER